MSTCEYCVYWDSNYFALPGRGNQLRPRYRWGVCGKIVGPASPAPDGSPRSNDDGEEFTAPAYVQDGSRYDATLRTKGVFGCNLFEGAATP